MASGRLCLQHHSPLAQHLVHTLEDLLGDQVLFQQMKKVKDREVSAGIRPSIVSIPAKRWMQGVSISISSIRGSESVNSCGSRWTPNNTSKGIGGRPPLLEAAQLRWMGMGFAGHQCRSFTLRRLRQCRRLLLRDPCQGSLEVTQKPVAEQVRASPAMPVDP